jgi:phage-related protein
MRPLIEILSDLNARTAHMTEAEREHALASIFSARAGGGLIAIMQGLGDGIRDSSGQLVTGQAAVEELRKRMAGAAGTAQEMKDRLLDTFEGQKKALVGSAQTLLQLVGEPFTEAFKPILSVVRRAFVAVNQFVAAIPGPVKKFMANAVLAVGAVIALIGAVMAVKAGIALLAVGVKILGITFGGVVASLLPAIALFAAAALVVAGLAVAFKRDIGGIRTFFENTWERIKLLFEGLAQLLKEGGFSGAVMEELNKAENSGIKQFAIRVYQIVFRIQRFFEGIAEGFGTAIDQAKPVFEAFTGALRELGEAFGLVGTAGADAVAGIGSDKFAKTGGSIGEVLAQIVTVIVDGLTIVIRIVTGIINGIREAFEFVKPVFDFVGEAIGFVAEEFSGLISDVVGVNDQAREGGSVWKTIGEVIGWVAGLIGGVLAGAIGVVAAALGTVIAIVRAVVQAFKWLGELIGETAARIFLFFTETIPRVFKTVANAVRAFFQPIVDFITGVVDSIRDVLDRVIAFVGRLVAKIPSRFRPAFLDSVVEAGEAAQARVAERAAKTAGPAIQAAVPVAAAAAVGMLPGTLGGPAAGVAMPAVSEVRARGQISDAEMDAIVSRGIALSEGRPVQANVTLTVDGEALARASARAERSTAARSFIPVPVPG